MAEKKFQSVLLVMAMEHEANPMIASLNLVEDKDFVNPFVLGYKGTLNSLKIGLVVAKKDPFFKIDAVGTENGSLSTYIGAQHYSPDLILSVGTAGGVLHKEKSQKLRVGDVCVPGSPLIFFDREIVFDIYKPYLAGGYPLTTSFDDLIGKLGFKKAQLGTQDSFVVGENKPAMEKKIDVIDMESAAVAKVSYWLNIPFLAMRVISDINKGSDPDHVDDQAESFQNNLQDVSAKLAEKVKEFLGNL